MVEKELATFRIDASQWEALKEKARSQNKTATALFLSWVQAYLDGNLDVNLDNIDKGVDNLDERLDKALAPLIDRLDRLEEELGKFAA